MEVFSIQGKFSGTSMLTGWLPTTIQVATLLLFAVALTPRRSARLPWKHVLVISAVIGIAIVLGAQALIRYEGLVGDPAPPSLWLWTASIGVSVVVFILGWPRARWWQRAASALTVPMALICTTLLVNIWVGYAPTVDAAWKFVRDRPFPNQTDMSDAIAIATSGVVPARGKIIRVSTGSDASGFSHRSEFVYLPPAWFTSVPPPRLPALMMIGGQFGKSSDWVWAGQSTLDAFAEAHSGYAPVTVFVDAGGAFTKDTECVNGSNGNAADHLTMDVVPFVINNFGVSAAGSNWGVAGWSMGGTCAIDLTVMHPDQFTAFIDITGDFGPNAGNKQQSIDKLFGGDEVAWAAFDPTTVMTRHGAYSGVSGVFATEDSNASNPANVSTKAALSLARVAAANGILCSILTTPGKHDWQFGASVFKDTLPWIAGQIGTPHVQQTAPPGVLVDLPTAPPSTPAQGQPGG